MADLGCDDLFGSLLALILLSRSGDIRTGSAPVEGKGASKSRSRGQQRPVRGARAGRLVSKGGGLPHAVAFCRDGAERKDIDLRDDISLLRVWYPILS